jgi:prepilin-type processing-associated H-X9-DG protein
LFAVPTGNGIGRSGAVGGYKIKRVTVDDLSATPPKPGASRRTRLDWVGRTHGGKWNVARTNFLYTDWHVETKPIADTLKPKFQWGETFYSLIENGDVEAERVDN